MFQNPRRQTLLPKEAPLVSIQKSKSHLQPLWLTEAPLKNCQFHKGKLPGSTVQRTDPVHNAIDRKPFISGVLSFSDGISSSCVVPAGRFQNRTSSFPPATK